MVVLCNRTQTERVRIATGPLRQCEASWPGQSVALLESMMRERQSREGYVAQQVASRPSSRCVHAAMRLVR